MKQISEEEEITVNEPVYTARDVMISMRANPLQGPLGSENCDFFRPKKAEIFRAKKMDLPPYKS
jgi:hypothetical protein